MHWFPSQIGFSCSVKTLTEKGSLRGARGRGGVPLTGTRGHQPREGTPTVSWTLPQQSLNQKMQHRSAHRPVWWGGFSQRRPFFQNDSRLCKADIKPKNTVAFLTAVTKCPRKQFGGRGVGVGGDGCDRLVGGYLGFQCEELHPSMVGGCGRRISRCSHCLQQEGERML